MKSKKILIAIIILILIPIILLAIICVKENKNPFYIDYTIEQWIGILQAILGYMGTGALGLLAFWQNEKSIEINDNLMKMQRDKDKDIRKPILKPVKIVIDDGYDKSMICCYKKYFKYDISESKFDHKTINCRNSYIKITLKNVSNNSLFDFKLTDIKLPKEKIILYKSSQLIVDNENLEIVANDNIIMMLFVSDEFMTQFRTKHREIEITITYTNAFGEVFEEIIKVSSLYSLHGSWQCSQNITNKESNVFKSEYFVN